MYYPKLVAKFCWSFVVSFHRVVFIFLCVPGSRVVFRFVCTRVSSRATYRKWSVAVRRGVFIWVWRMPLVSYIWGTLEKLIYLSKHSRNLSAIRICIEKYYRILLLSTVLGLVALSIVMCYISRLIMLFIAIAVSIRHKNRINIS